MKVGYAPVVPERRPVPSDREWVTAYAKRSRAARLRRYNLNAAADVESQSRELALAWAGQAHQAERRAAARSRVRGLLADAAFRNTVAAYQRDRREMLALIARISAPGRRPFARRGVAARNEPVTCQACLAVGADPWESWAIHHSDADGNPLAASPGVPVPVPPDDSERSAARYGREVTRLATR